MQEFDRATAVCFTGHRTLPPAQRAELIERTDRAIRTLAARGFVTFIAGGAIGFDTLAACRVVIARRSLPQLRLVLALPCHNQTEHWTSLEDLRLYQMLLGQADEVLYLAPMYTPTCMRERNRWMVAHAAFCIAYLQKPGGGTAMTVRMAREAGLGILNIAEEPLPRRP